MSEETPMAATKESSELSSAWTGPTAPSAPSDYAAHEAARTGAILQIVSVYNIPTEGSWVRTGLFHEEATAIVEGSLEQVRRIEPDVVGKGAVTLGVPGQVLTEIAEGASASSLAPGDMGIWQPDPRLGIRIRAARCNVHDDHRSLTQDDDHRQLALCPRCRFSASRGRGDADALGVHRHLRRGPIAERGRSASPRRAPSARLVPAAVRAPAPAESTCRAVAPGATDVGGRQVIRHPFTTFESAGSPIRGTRHSCSSSVVICLRSRLIDPARCGSSSSSPGSPMIGLPFVEKLHHSMADGISTAELATVLLDLSAEACRFTPGLSLGARPGPHDRRAHASTTCSAWPAWPSACRPGSDGRSPTLSAGPVRRNDWARRWRPCCPPASSLGHPRSTARSGTSERYT